MENLQSKALTHTKRRMRIWLKMCVTLNNYSLRVFLLMGTSFVSLSFMVSVLYSCSFFFIDHMLKTHHIKISNPNRVSLSYLLALSVHLSVSIHIKPDPMVRSTTEWSFDRDGLSVSILFFPVHLIVLSSSLKPWSLGILLVSLCGQVKAVNCIHPSVPGVKRYLIKEQEW